MTHKHWFIVAGLAGLAVGFFVTSLSNSGIGASVYVAGNNAASSF